MAQSYVGKHAISKGIGRAIRKFVAFAFSAHVLGHRRRACAVPDIQKRASHLVRGTLRSVFPAADAICWKNHHLGNSKAPQAGSVLQRKSRTAAAASVGGEEAARRRPLWQHATRRQGGARPVCLTQDWIGPTGDTSKQRFGSTKLKV